MNASGGPGVFTISLDTELAWGSFDKGETGRYVDAYYGTREVVSRLCNLFDEYGMSATWAVVAHLVTDCDGPGAHEHLPEPDFAWVDSWQESLPCSRGLDEELWYAPELVEEIRSCDHPQEVGLHGYTHMPIGADGCDQRVAAAELAAGVDTLRNFGVEPESFVYPRNVVGHESVLADHGIKVYRDVDARWYEQSVLPEQLKKAARFADEAAGLTPPVVVPEERHGVVRVQGSQPFRPRHGGWQFTPPQSSFRRAKRGIDRAVETGGVFHLWFHPFNLASEPDILLNTLARILAYADSRREEGVLDLLPLREIAAACRAGRWNRKRNNSSVEK